MTVAEVKREVMYYTGRSCTTAEAEEILTYYEMNKGASLDEIISEYFGCE